MCHHLEWQQYTVYTFAKALCANRNNTTSTPADAQSSTVNSVRMSVRLPKRCKIRQVSRGQ